MYRCKNKWPSIYKVAKVRFTMDTIDIGWSQNDGVTPLFFKLKIDYDQGGFV